MNTKGVTHYGFNWTHRGHYMRPNHWIAVSEQEVIGKINHLIENERRLCRVWVLRSDGKSECVFWWERPALLTQEDAADELA